MNEDSGKETAKKKEQVAIADAEWLPKTNGATHTPVMVQLDKKGRQRHACDGKTAALELEAHGLDKLMTGRSSPRTLQNATNGL